MTVILTTFNACKAVALTTSLSRCTHCPQTSEKASSLFHWRFFRLTRVGPTSAHIFQLIVAFTGSLLHKYCVSYFQSSHHRNHVKYLHRVIKVWIVTLHTTTNVSLRYIQMRWNIMHINRFRVVHLVLLVCASANSGLHTFSHRDLVMPHGVIDLGSTFSQLMAFWRCLFYSCNTGPCEWINSLIVE